MKNLLKKFPFKELTRKKTFRKYRLPKGHRLFYVCIIVKRYTETIW